MEKGRKEGWMNRWMYGWMDEGWKDGWVGEWTDRWIAGWMDGRTEKMDGCKGGWAGRKLGAENDYCLGYLFPRVTSVF